MRAYLRDARIVAAWSLPVPKLALRPGAWFWFRRPRAGATCAVGLLCGGDPVLIVYRPAAVRLPHSRHGHVYPADPVRLTNVHISPSRRLSPESTLPPTGAGGSSVAGQLVGRASSSVSGATEKVGEHFELGLPVPGADLIHRGVHARVQAHQLCAPSP